MRSSRRKRAGQGMVLASWRSTCLIMTPKSTGRFLENCTQGLKLSFRRNGKCSAEALLHPKAELPLAKTASQAGSQTGQILWRTVQTARARGNRHHLRAHYPGVGPPPELLSGGRRYAHNLSGLEVPESVSAFAV